MTDEQYPIEDPEDDVEDEEPRWFNVLAIPGAILGWLDRAAQSFEMLLEEFAGAAGAASQITDRADGWLGQIAHLLLFPFVAFWRSAELVGGWLQEIPFVGPVFKVLRWIFYPLIAIAGFVTAFAQTRPQATLLWAMPMLIMAGAIGLVYYANYLSRETAIPIRYRAAILEAIEDQDQERANLFRQKLRQLGQPFGHTDLEAAERLMAQGRPLDALKTVQDLAPETSPGEPAAHYWIAANLVDGNIPIDRKEALRLADGHLTQLRSLGFGDRPEISLATALVELRREQPEAALDILTPLSTSYFPAAELRLSLLINLGQDGLAFEAAGDFLKLGFSDPQLLETVPVDQLKLWETAAVMRSDFTSLGKILGEWHRRSPDDQELTARLAQHELRDLERFHAGSSTAEAGLIVDLIDRVAGMIDRDHRNVLSVELARLRRESSRTPVFAEALKRLEQVSSQGIVIEYLGTEAAVSGDWNRSRALLERATEIDPEDAVAWNNLAFVILRSGGDLSQALRAAERSLALIPHNANARETRGMIRFRLGEWEQAVGDLEFAYVAFPDSADLRQALAGCYERLGQMDKAALYRRNSAQSPVTENR